MCVRPPYLLWKPLTATPLLRSSLSLIILPRPKNSRHHFPQHAPLSPKINRRCLNKPLSVHMASIGNSSSDSSMAALDRTTALQAWRTSAISGVISVFGPALPGTGFETLPPIAILFKPFQCLRSLSLKSVRLGFNCIPFHSGWELVELRPKLSKLELHVVEVLKICDEVKEEEPLEFLGLKLNLTCQTLLTWVNPQLRLQESRLPWWSR